MASKKLEIAIAQKNVVVKNVISGEISLLINGSTYTIASGEKLEIFTKNKQLVSKVTQTLAIPGLAEQIKLNRLILI